MKVVEHSVSTARSRLGGLVQAAHNEGQVTYLTSGGFRVAAIVPLDLAPPAPTRDRMPQGLSYTHTGNGGYTLESQTAEQAAVGD